MIAALISLALTGWILDPAAIGAFQASPAAGQTAAEAMGEPTTGEAVGHFVPPRWINSPSAEAATELMPGFAAGIGIPGSVRLSCWVEEQGLPKDCDVVSAAPEGLGFEAAALEVARTGVVRPAMLDGVPVRATVEFNVAFQAERIEDSSWEPVPYEGPEPTPRALALARQIVLRTIDASLQAEEETLLGGLADDRREIVRDWLFALRPLDAEISIRNQTLMIARLSTEADMSAYVTGGTLPLSPIPTPEQIAVATSDLADPNDRAVWIEVRDRYCARWACASPETAD